MKKQSEKKKKILNRRGVTIVETVIAMAVIITVSLTAITVIRRVSITTMEDQYNREAINVAENAKQCLIFADTVEEFAAAFGSVLQTQDGDTVEVNTAGKSYYLNLHRDTYDVTMQISYASNRPNMYVFSTAHSTYPRVVSRTLFTFNYQKAEVTP